MSVCNTHAEHVDELQEREHQTALFDQVDIAATDSEMIDVHMAVDSHGVRVDPDTLGLRDATRVQYWAGAEEQCLSVSAEAFV